MKVATWLKQHPDVTEVYIVAGIECCRLCVSDDSDMAMFGNLKIKEVEPPPDEQELVSLHI